MWKPEHCFIRFCGRIFFNEVNNMWGANEVSNHNFQRRHHSEGSSQHLKWFHWFEFWMIYYFITALPKLPLLRWDGTPASCCPASSWYILPTVNLLMTAADLLFQAPMLRTSWLVDLLWESLPPATSQIASSSIDLHEGWGPCVHFRKPWPKPGGFPKES